jgi:micrococcal nuclease
MRKLIIGAVLALALAACGSNPHATAPRSTATERSATTASPTTSRPLATRTTRYYADCAEAKKAGVAPIHRGDPGYRSGLDRDDDGIACDK